jgi:hypothetical protein
MTDQPHDAENAGSRQVADDPAAVPAVRAQLLATEHWSLLATRGMTWSEVMSRIAIHLTVASAALVVLALVTQAAGFGTAFQVLSIGLTSAVLLLGTLTGIRVHNASVDDAAILLGMNRLRAAYVELDPGMQRFLVTGWNDDMAGLMRTYTMGARRGMLSHVLGSTSIFMVAVYSMLAGTLAALVTDAAGGGVVLVTVLGLLAGMAYLGAMLEVGRRSFGSAPTEVIFPST